MCVVVTVGWGQPSSYALLPSCTSGYTSSTSGILHSASAYSMSLARFVVSSTHCEIVLTVDPVGIQTQGPKDSD